MPKISPESDAQPVESVSACPGPALSYSSDLLWVVCAELLDSIRFVVKAALQVFSKVQVHRPADSVEDFAFEKLLMSTPGCTHCLIIAPRDTVTHKMRGTTAPDICGMTALSSETLAAFRCAELAARLQYQGTRWIIECSVSKEPSVFDLPEIRGLLSHSGVTATRVDLQKFGCSQHSVSPIFSNVKPDEPRRGKLGRDADKKISASTGAKLRFPFYGENWRAQRPARPTSQRRPSTSRSRPS